MAREQELFVLYRSKVDLEIEVDFLPVTVSDVVSSLLSNVS